MASRKGSVGVVTGPEPVLMLNEVQLQAVVEAASEAATSAAVNLVTQNLDNWVRILNAIIAEAQEKVADLVASAARVDTVGAVAAYTTALCQVRASNAEYGPYEMEVADLLRSAIISLLTPQPTAIEQGDKP